MMKHSPYLNQDRDLDDLLRLVREYDAQIKSPRNPAMPVRAGKRMAAAVNGPVRVTPGTSPLKRAS